MVKKNKSLVDILITTFPARKSQNVGDNLISNSALKLVKSRNPNYSPTVVFREQLLDGFSKKRTRSILAPGFSVSNGVYPDLCALYSDNSRLRNFFPIGCSYQHTIPAESSFIEDPYDESTLLFLEDIATRFGAIHCRDDLIVKRLRKFNIPAVYSGDLVLFDEDYLQKTFIPPKEIKSIVFTVQHHLHYLEQSLDLLKRIKLKFPEAKCYVALHSVPGTYAKTVADRAAQLGYEILHQYGDASNLEKYNAFDLHIGYRLHGHITFLRKRKPSILLVEDARAYGFSMTGGTSHGCIQAYDQESGMPSVTAPSYAMNFLEEQLHKRFDGYNSVFQFVDETFNEIVAPHFDQIAKITKSEYL